MAENDTQTTAVLEPPPPTPPTRVGAGEQPPERPGHIGWDFALMIATVVLLAALGVQSLMGTVIVWWGQRNDPSWMQTQYPGFVQGMDAFAAPLMVALVVVMGLCVPKRLFDRALLIIISMAMVVLGLVVGLLRGSLGDGLAVYLVAAALIQVAVVVATITGIGGLSYLTHGKVTRVGSGLLHLGFVLFLLVVVALQDSEWMLPVFWASTALLVGGSVLSFYSNRIAEIFRPGKERPLGAEPDPDAPEEDRPIPPGPAPDVPEE